MGFWHTGYMEFHEPVGLDFKFVPAPVRYPCGECGAEFASVEALRNHRFEHHRLLRPTLIIQGQELGNAPMHIGRALATGDVVALRAATATLNGKAVNLEDLGRLLAAYTNDRVFVTLSRQGIAATFELQFAVASEADLRGVDRCVLGLAQTKYLDLRAIQSFIEAAHPFPTALRYCDGICQYLYGVLAKERAKDSYLRYEDYLDRWNHAADTLKGFQRPFAAAVTALIAFHFNHFADAAQLVPGSRLGIAAKKYWYWVDGVPKRPGPRVVDVTMDPIHELFADFATTKLVEWVLHRPALLAAEVPDIVAMANADVAEYDRTKARILLAEHWGAAGESRQAKQMARELLHDPRLGPWAERLTQRLTALEQDHA